MRVHTNPRDVLFRLSAERSRPVVAVLVSIAFHAVILSLPGPPNTALQAERPSSFAALPVELAGGVSSTSFSSSAPGPRESHTPLPAVAASPPSAARGSPRNGPTKEPGASLPDKNIAPQRPISPETGVSTRAGPLTASLSPPVGSGTAPGLAQPATGQGVSGTATTPGSQEEGSSPGGNSGTGGSPKGSPGGTGVSGGGKVVPPKVIYRPDQPYPDRARRRKEEGPVYLKARVLVAGSAGNVEILSSPGSRDLEQAAIEWVKKWKFAPATLDGRPVEHEFVIRINFRL